jgi:hypothetical protein
MAVTIRSPTADQLAQRRGYRAGVCQQREMVADQFRYAPAEFAGPRRERPASAASAGDRRGSAPP